MTSSQHIFFRQLKQYCQSVTRYCFVTLSFCLPGDPEASFTKEEMQQGKHQEYEKKLHDQLISATLNRSVDDCQSIS